MPTLREHYEQQETHVLLDIATKDLREEARVVLLQVLADRGVDVDEAQTAHAAGVEARAAADHVEEVLGSLGRRGVAFAIDSLGVLIVLLIVMTPVTVAVPTIGNTVLSIAWCGYFLLRDSIPGQGLGKRFLGLRVVDRSSGKSCTWPRSIGRNVTHLLFIVDALFALGRSRRRLGDMLTDTVVVRSDAVLTPVLGRLS